MSVTVDVMAFVFLQLRAIPCVVMMKGGGDGMSLKCGRAQAGHEIIESGIVGRESRGPGRAQPSSHNPAYLLDGA